MKRNPFKDKSIPKPTPKPQPAMTPEEQKAFEAEVQERIRQAKMHLKASNPFKKEETTEDPKPQVDKPISVQSSTNSTAEQKAFEDEVQERIRQAKLELKANNPFLKDEKENNNSTPLNQSVPISSIENKATLEKNQNENKFQEEKNNPPAQQAISNSITKSIQESAEWLDNSVKADINTDKLVAEWTQKVDEQKQATLQAEQKVKQLEEKLNQLQNTKTKTTNQERKPVYGMAAATPNNETITKEDLKLEFLNFTSAHIDQFNNRIRKTEELVASIANTTPQEVQKSNGGSSRFQWLNTALLAICTLLLLALYFKKDINSSTESNAEIQANSVVSATPPPTNPESSSQKLNGETATTPNQNKVEASNSEIQSPTVASNATAASPEKETTSPTAVKTENKTTANPSPSIATPKAATVATAPQPANIPKTQASNTSVSKMPSFERQPATAKPVANNVVTASPSAKPASLVVRSNVPAPKTAAPVPVKSSAASSSPNTNASKPAVRNQRSLEDAIRPVEPNYSDRRMTSKKTQKTQAEKKTNQPKPAKTEEPKPIAKPQPKKTSTQSNDVFFGDD